MKQSRENGLSALDEAIKQHDQYKEKRKDNAVDEIALAAAQNRKLIKLVKSVSAGLCGLLALGGLYLFVKEPQYRGLYLFFMASLALWGTWEFWRKNS